MTLAQTSQPPWPLEGRSNNYAYVTGLYDTSSAGWPLIADGFVPGGTSYTNQQNQPGGVWQGLNAIVVFTDDSARIIKCNNSFQVPGGPNGLLFDTSGNNGWMGGGTGSTVQVVNPLIQ